jgi:hypothetical protein
MAADLQRARAVLCRLEQEVSKLQLHPGKPLAGLDQREELLGDCGWHACWFAILPDMSYANSS